MLILTNEEIQSVIDMPAAVSELEKAFRELAEQRAVNQVRREIFFQNDPDENTYYVFKLFEGLVAEQKMVALRVNSDIIRWRKVGENLRKSKLSRAPGNRYVCLIHLFSTETGEPLAVFPDAVIQRFRVGATNGLGAKYLARKEARSLGLLGAGWQAGAQLMAICAVRPIEKIKVFSPTAEKCRDFAREWSEKLKVSVEPAATPQAAVRGVDIIASATNSIAPTIQSNWVEAGMHITCLRRTEIDLKTVSLCDRVLVNSKAFQPQRKFVGGEAAEKKHPEWGRKRPAADRLVSWKEMPDLVDLFSGRVSGRRSPDEKTCFANVIGLGIQFVAVAGMVYKRAIKKGLGTEIPTDLFLQDLR